MNYIKEIRAFYDSVNVKPLSTGQIALWHALMHINNKNNWSEWFSVPGITLELLTGLSRSAIFKNRNALKQAGLIEFKANGTRAASYKMIAQFNETISNSAQDSTQDSAQNSTQDSAQDGAQNSTQNSGPLNKHKQKQKLKLSKENIKRKIAAFTNDASLRSALVCFCEIRLGMKTPFTENALDLLLKKLTELEKSEEGRLAVVQQSIERGWSGFFPLKKDAQNQKYNYKRPAADDLPY